MELVNDLFRIREALPDAGQAALGHVAGNSSNVGSLPTMPFKLLPHGDYCFLLAAVLNIEDAALHRINGDGHIIMTTLTGCFIDCQFGNVAQVKRFYRMIHPLSKDGCQCLLIAAKEPVCFPARNIRHDHHGISFE